VRRRAVRVRQEETGVIVLELREAEAETPEVVVIPQEPAKHDT
jgi:hypothetical protein